MRKLNLFHWFIIVAALGIVASVCCAGCAGETPTEGIVIGGAVVAAFVGGFVLMYLKYRKELPQDWIYGQEARVGVRWFGDVQRPWPGLHLAVLAIESVLVRRYGAAKARELLDVWIDVWPSTGLRSREAPTGTRREVDGSITTIGGTVSVWSALLGLKRKTTIVVVQTRENKERLTTGEVTMWGPLEDAIKSALVHEIANHRVPLVLSNDRNENHASIWRKLERDILDEYQRLGTTLNNSAMRDQPDEP